MPHVFKQITYADYNNQIVITPIRYSGDGINTNMSTNHCSDDIEHTFGQVLSSSSLMKNQESCAPNVKNAGNWYSWKATTADTNIGTGNSSDSICPSGWRMPKSDLVGDSDFYNLIRFTYGVLDIGDNQLRTNPLPFVRSGLYNGDIMTGRASDGRYWSSLTAGVDNAYYFYMYNNYNYIQISGGKQLGLSLRCVAVKVLTRSVVHKEGFTAGFLQKRSSCGRYLRRRASASIPHIILNHCGYVNYFAFFGDE